MERPGPHPAGALGRAQSQAGGLPVLGDPRAAAPATARRRSATAVPNAGLRPERHLQTVRCGDQPRGCRIRSPGGFASAAARARKTDLAGGQLPSWLFGANAAWWALSILAHNLNIAMKRLVLGTGWLAKQMKALRLRLIGLPGWVVSHARKLIIRLGAGAEALGLIISARQSIRALACGPSG